MNFDFDKNLREYQETINRGSFVRVYKRLIDSTGRIRLHLNKLNSLKLYVGNIHIGIMDWTYFSATSKNLKKHKLKTVILLNHKNLRYEVRLVGRNKKIQKAFWETLTKNNRTGYKLSESPTESIIEHVLIAQPSFNDINALIEQVTRAFLEFNNTIEQNIAS